MQRISSFFEWWKQGACVNYDAVLFDIDGTLILGRGNPMPVRRRSLIICTGIVSRSVC